MEKRKWSKSGTILAVLYLTIVVVVYIFETRSCGITLHGEFCGVFISLFTFPSTSIIGMIIVPIIDFVGDIPFLLLALLATLLNAVVIYYLGKGVDKLFSYL